MCGMQGLLCIIIRGCVGGYDNEWGARPLGRNYLFEGRGAGALTVSQCQCTPHFLSDFAREMRPLLAHTIDLSKNSTTGPASLY